MPKYEVVKREVWRVAVVVEATDEKHAVERVVREEGTEMDREFDRDFHVETWSVELVEEP